MTHPQGEPLTRENAVSFGLSPIAVEVYINSGYAFTCIASQPSTPVDPSSGEGDPASEEPRHTIVCTVSSSVDLAEASRLLGKLFDRVEGPFETADGPQFRLYIHNTMFRDLFALLVGTFRSSIASADPQA
jgi:hypothetical protein